MAWSKIIIIICIGSVLGTALAFLLYFQQFNQKQQNFYLNNKKIILEIAKTPAEQYHGLSDRDSLCKQCGMLFISKTADNKIFVMRKMQFPLDIIWVNQQTVVGISKNLPPEQSDPYTPYPSPGPVDWVLELNAGGADFYNLEIGKKINLHSLK